MSEKKKKNKEKDWELDFAESLSLEQASSYVQELGRQLATGAFSVVTSDARLSFGVSGLVALRLRGKASKTQALRLEIEWEPTPRTVKPVLRFERPDEDTEEPAAEAELVEEGEQPEATNSHSSPSKRRARSRA